MKAVPAHGAGRRPRDGVEPVAGREPSDVVRFPALDRVRRYVRACLEASEAHEGVVTITVPAPRAAPRVLLRALPLPWGTLWQPCGGPALAGLGAAAVIEVEGPERLPILRARARALFDDLAFWAWPDLPHPRPRLLGGLAFAPGAQGHPWQAFGDGCFTLPRWTLGRDEERAWLTLAVGPGQRDGALDELEAIWRALEAAAQEEEPASRDPAPSGRIEQLDPQVWERYVEQIRGAIQAGRFEKVVAARMAVVEGAFDDLEVARRLRAGYPRCHVFAFQRPGGTFVGASPERLFRRTGSALETHALAGSLELEPGQDPAAAAEALLASGKNRWEHHVVVREIAEGLAPLSHVVEYPDAPTLVQVRNLLHLNTPVRATVRDTTHPLDLVEVLHPTPAVGGVPKRDAISFIQEEEPTERGWYTGTVGWFDAAGDSEFVVSIRCGIVEPTRAYVFAGAGIVLESDPAAEYAETALKQQPLLRALGVEA